MSWSFDTDRPIYIQLQERIKTMIAAGKYPPGERIPPVRELAEQTSVNPNTLQRALSELEREGLLISQRTSGRFVTEDRKMIENLGKELAREQISRFLENMKAIGIAPDEAAKLILEYKEDEENGDS